MSTVSGFPVLTLQNEQALVHISPKIIKVTCFFCQHSEILGHAASSQTVTRLFFFTMSLVILNRFEVGALTFIQAGFLGKGLDILLNKINQGLDIVLLLKLEDDIIVKRMAGRRVHAPSGRIYHIKFNPPKISDKDDITGENLIIRPDDQEKTVRNRLEVYRNQTAPLIDYYNKLSILKEIDAEGNIQKIKLKINQVIKSV